jgi:fructose-1,6-bisphosphatase II
MTMKTIPDRNLALELARVTEAAALASARWMGRGDKNQVDRAAVEAMRLVLNTVDMDGIVVIGEGEKDQAPMLFNGERLGTGQPPQVDIAVDPVEGTSLLAMGQPNALSVVALSERGTMFFPGPIVYMDKIAVGPQARGAVDIEAPVAVNLRNVARALDKDMRDLTVVMLDRERHQKLVQAVRHAGARIRLLPHGDVAGGLMTAMESTGIDVLLGVGGAPEAVLTACALKCVGGEIQTKLWPRDEAEKKRAMDAGLDLDKIYHTDDLCAGDNVFFSATGVTSGELLQGVRYFGGGAKTHTLVMRSKSGTVRMIEATHRWEKLMRFSQIAFD